MRSGMSVPAVDRFVRYLGDHPGLWQERVVIDSDGSVTDFDGFSLNLVALRAGVVDAFRVSSEDRVAV